ncbi:hypothetical protein N7530_004728 [Penicillium desertorum]|uniref:Uncharacterized protein n=1 Tax=Penicillium desertorum TaxID=1303715 RepID=A0A9W9WYT8_9EURO|nr:hypothetical protein N7530_004728 [Penicillium desertorum]
MPSKCGIPDTLAPSAKLQCYNMGQHGLIQHPFSIVERLFGYFLDSAPMMVHFSLKLMSCDALTQLH